MRDEDREIEIVELDSDDGEAFSPGRLFTVAAAGALASLGLYYLYHQLDEDKRASLRRKASGLVADQLHRWTDSEEDLREL